jgi:hypothetical protein
MTFCDQTLEVTLLQLETPLTKSAHIQKGGPQTLPLDRRGAKSFSTIF